MLRADSIGIEGPLSHAGSSLEAQPCALIAIAHALLDGRHHQTSDTHGVLDVEFVDERP